MGVTVSLAQKSPIPDKPGGSLKKTWMTRGKLVCLEGPVITCTISQKAENGHRQRSGFDFQLSDRKLEKARFEMEQKNIDVIY